MKTILLALTISTGLLAVAWSTTLTWTAPGDDGNVGTAAEYDLRVSTDSITEDNWDAAGQVIGEPTPSVAGTVEECTIGGLDANTTYYFAIKTADEKPNWSGLSNVVRVVNCPCDTTNRDLNCDGVWDISDLVWYIDKCFPQGGE